MEENINIDSMGPVMDSENLIGRRDIYDKLDQKVYVKSPDNFILMGVQGTGKTSILRSYFDLNRRMELVEKYKRIYHFVSFPIDPGEDGIFGYLVDYVCSAIDILKKIAVKTNNEKYLNEYNEMLEIAMTKKKITDHKQTCLEEILKDYFFYYGYTFTILIDDFHNFTLSPKVTYENHGTLNGLFRDHKWLSAIAATNYDLTSKYIAALHENGRHRSNSLYIQSFSEKQILVGGFDAADTKQFIHMRFRDIAPLFSEQEYAVICQTTGGIPELIAVYMSAVSRLIADTGWDIGLQEKQRVFDEAVSIALPHLRTLFKSWCKLMDKGSVDALCHICSQFSAGFQNDSKLIKNKKVFYDNAGELEGRGLLVRTDFPLGYNFSSRLFMEYFRENQEELIEMAKKTDPDNIDYDSLAAHELSKSLKKQPSGKGNYAFISYSSENRSAADAMRLLLQENKINCWMAPYDISGGKKYAYELNDALEECSCLVLLLTDAAQKSNHVEREIDRAVTYSKPIITLQLENIELNSGFKYYLGSTHIPFVSEIDGKLPEIAKVLDEIRKLTEG